MSDYEFLSFDPGGTTGVCYGKLTDTEFRLLPHQERLTSIGIYNLIAGQVDHIDSIVYESFEFRKGARAGLDLTPVELIGVIKLFTHKVPLYSQTAFTGKGYYTDPLLKKLGVYVPAKPHSMDATRHLLHWFTFGPGYRFNKDQEIKLA